MLPKLEELKELITKSKSKVIELYPDVGYELSHVGYMVKDKQNYEKYKKIFEKDCDFVNEVLHSGRRIALFKIKESFDYEGLHISRVELFEPKPNSTSTENKWEHISFKVHDLEGMISKYKHTEYALQKIRQIDGDKWGYYLFNGYRIQFRNRYFGEAKIESSIPTKKIDPEKKEVDYKSLYNQEKEKRLRLLADIDNEKKLLQRQKEEFIKIANLALVQDLFTIIDDLKRAIDNKISDKDSINMIYNKILGILNNYGVIPLDTKVGDEFDSTKMEAISTTKVLDKKQNNKVIHIEQQGFKYREDDRIIKPCRVIVGKV